LADKNYSVDLNVSVGATLDEASVKEVERKVQDRLAKSVEVNVKLSEAAERSAALRAQRGLPPRTPKGTAKDINFNELFKAELFKKLELPSELRGGVKLALPKFDLADPASGIGEKLEVVGGQFSELKKKLKEVEDDLAGDSEDIARMDFGGKISDELERLKDAAKASNTFMAEISKASGIKTLNIDYLKDLDGFEAEVSTLTDGLMQLEDGNVDLAMMELTKRFALIGDTLVPNAVIAQEAFLEAARMAQMIGVPVAGGDTKYSVSQREIRGVPAGTDRSSLGDSKQAERITAAWQKQIMGLAQKPETANATAAWINSLIDSIAEDIYQQAAQAMQDSADYFAAREFKGGEFDTGFITKSESADVSPGSNEMGYWLEDFVSKIRELTLKRGFEPGSEIEIAKRLRAQREQGVGGQLSFQEETLFTALEHQFTVVESGFQDFNANLSQSANFISDQILNNPAIVSTKPLGGGAQKEIKELTADLPAQIKQIQELGTASVGAAESVKSLRDQAKDSSNAELDISKAEFELESAKDYASSFQKLADDETRSLEQRAASAKAAEAKVLEQAELEKKLIQLKAKQTAAEISAVENELAAQAPEPELASGMATWQQKFLDDLSKFGKIAEVAFDVEYNEALGQKLTEAAITVKDKLNGFVDLFSFVQAPPNDTWATNPNIQFQPGSRKDLEIIASKAMIPGGVGSQDPVENLKDFYEKIQKTVFILQTLADQGAVIVGNNAGQTDLNNLAKAIKYINDTNKQLGAGLPEMQNPFAKAQTFEANKILGKSESEVAKVLTSNGKSLTNLILKIKEHYSDFLTEEEKSFFRTTKSGLEVRVQDVQTGMEAWLPAHYAKVDNRIALVIKSVLDKLLPVESSQTLETADYAAQLLVKEAKNAPRNAKRDSAGAGQPPAGGAAGASGESADNAQKTFLAVTQIQAITAELTEQEQKLANQALKKLQNQEEYKRLLDKEKGIREEIADMSGVLPSGAQGPDTEQVRAAKDNLNFTIVQGRELERQMFEQVKATTRAGDVSKKYQNTAAMTVDTQIQLEKATKKAFSSEIQAQMREQVQAAKDVEKQTKSLINQWVTGRYALYDVGNAYAEVSRQLWSAARQIFNVTQAYRSYETAFTSVERAIQPLAASIEGLIATEEAALEETASLKNAFIELSEQIPISFEEISRIATLGAQMGVSASGIVDFTKVVAEFSSVTGVAADTVAQKFGRIAELANVDYSQFSNLGSSILFAGMNAVATEPEIMTLAESIAAVSSQAGLVPSEIVGMATALASTGIQAEQARGVFTRVFADIDRAVSKGGSGLNNFAAIAGMSSENFASAWGTEGASYDVFRAILGGLGATEDLTAAFDSLNIVETREINTLTRLAENLNVVDQAISDANSSFENGTFLGNTFEKTVDNLDAKIQLFNNNVKSLTEELSKGMAGSLKFLIDGFNEFLQIAKEVAKNPLFSNLAVASLAVTALGAAATLGVSAFAKLIAQIYAFRVAAVNTANDAKGAMGITGMLKQLTGWGSGLLEMRNELKGFGSDVRGVLTPMEMKSTDSLADSFSKRANSMRLFGNEVRKTDRVKTSLLKTENIYLASTKDEADLITRLISERANDINSIEMRTGAIVHSYDATVAEQSAINRGEATIESVNAARLKERESLLQAIGNKQIHVTTINGETVAYTQNQIATDKATLSSQAATVQEKAEAKARLENKVAIDMETRSATRANKMTLGPGAALVGVATGLGTALAAFTAISAVISGIGALIEKSKINILESGGGLASLRDAIKQDTLEYQKLTVEQQRSTDQYIKFNAQVRTNTSELDPNAEAIATVTGLSSQYVAANQLATNSIEEQTFAIGKNTREWIANAMMQDENLQKLLEDYPNFFKDLESMGLNFTDLLNEMLADPENVKNPVADIIKSTEAELSKLQTKMSNYAFDPSLMTPEEAAETEAEIKRLTTALSKLYGASQLFDSMGDAIGGALNQSTLYESIRAVLGLGDATEETTDDLNDLGDALRTVLDYASDLNGILSRVIELEFGKQMTRDDITTGWRDLAESAEDAKKAIEDANNEIKGLTADRSILEYQLSVAERYGDEARAAKIRAELAKVNKNITDSEKQLAEAQSEASTQLDGNSDAAIRNRGALIDMLGTYQARIEMLAKLGMNESELTQSSEDLKRQFLAEAKALGFSEDQLADYAKAFDNFADVASNAPRDVDIEVNPLLTAAEQAINEFISKDRSGNPIELDIEPDTVEAEVELNKWLNQAREFKKPNVTGMEPGEANRALNAWLLKMRYFQPIIADRIDTKDAETELQKLLNTTRIINVQLKIKIDKDLLLAQADNIYKLAIASKSNKTAYDAYIDTYRIINGIANRMASGGIVKGPGSGTSDSIPTMLSNGEYVVKASSVNAYGVDFFNALNQQRVGFSPASNMSGAMSQQGPSMVFLSPEDRQLLRQFGDRPVNLYADSTKIAEVANSGNTKMSRRGSR
jgi:TP901 family phage tail tape measure protein